MWWLMLARCPERTHHSESDQYRTSADRCAQTEVLQTRSKCRFKTRASIPFCVSFSREPFLEETLACLTELRYLNGSNLVSENLPTLV